MNSEYNPGVETRVAVSQKLSTITGCWDSCIGRTHSACSPPEAVVRITTSSSVYLKSLYCTVLPSVILLPQRTLPCTVC